MKRYYLHHSEDGSVEIELLEPSDILHDGERNERLQWVKYLEWEESHEALEQELKEIKQKYEGASLFNSDWCPVCEQGWNCAKDDAKHRLLLHKAEQENEKLKTVLEEVLSLRTEDEDGNYVVWLGESIFLRIDAFLHPDKYPDISTEQMTEWLKEK